MSKNACAAAATWAFLVANGGCAQLSGVNDLVFREQAEAGADEGVEASAGSGGSAGADAAAGAGSAGSSGTAGTGEDGGSAVCGDGKVTPPEVCDDGFKDACGTCNADCSGAGTGSICGDKLVCPETEVCDDGFKDMCGLCDETCTGPGSWQCGCVSGAPDDVFQGGMVGCKGKVIFPDRAQLCSSGFHVCTSPQWVALRGGMAPSHNYWTDDGPRYFSDGGSSGNCFASVSNCGSGCGVCPSADSPMRVCVSAATDPLGNGCTWFDCGLTTKLPNEHFGGCLNPTAGALCCPN